ncbi:MBL fold metallo-hydrolase [[Mycobacterium] vasticus]|uniref:MBL fold metallo-hydrolase n=1 Tax=[Mycobacterium] vasticus TaxID=2875777 RepID=A0ABU5Z2V3_9MYCO|nr:MBL fold metallo-hydrolase [Mycolicibacter sp. MYC017]MEB3071721.1 MBL fold metallo-hydrolase [Mycolicibacter sp. MYC017]
MKIGALTIDPVYDGTGLEPARESLTRPDVADAWACHGHLLDDHGNLKLTVGGFLLRTADRVILIDAGVGTIDNGKYSGGQFLESLRALGAEPEDVTDVVFTHLHFDHVGWATKKSKIVFPRATYRVHAADWTHFVEASDADPGAVRKLSPLADQLQTFDTDSTLAPGLDTRHVPGHTPGSTIFIVSSEGQRALLLGDVAHSAIELTDPTWEAVFDVDKAAGQRVRAKLIDELTDQPDVVAGAHFPGLRFGRLITVAGERQFKYL